MKKIVLNNYLTDNRLSLLTQVIPTNNINFDKESLSFDTIFIHNRKTHSELVSKIGEKLINKWDKFNNLNKNQKEEMKIILYNTCMLHDIGQTSYGHSLADLIDRTIEKYNKNLFFDDNSNNLIFLEIYNLKKILKTLGISYNQNIDIIDKLIDIKDEETYYSLLYNLYYKNEENKNLKKEDLINFKENLENENEDLILDKELFCYLIKRPIVLNRKLNIKKGLYPSLHLKYISKFFELKKKEIKNNLEISKTQLNLTWFMDMADELAYNCGDLSNFLNLYFNKEKFKNFININYPENEIKKIDNIKKEILKKCNFPFIKNINENTDFKMIENKLVNYFIENIQIDENKIYKENIFDLFKNKETKDFFQNIQYINYKIYIDFVKNNLENEYGNRNKNMIISKNMLNDIFKGIYKSKKIVIPEFLINNIDSSLYKNLINFNIKNNNKNKISLLLINYLTEININQFDKLLQKYIQSKKNSKIEKNLEKN